MAAAVGSRLTVRGSLGIATGLALVPLLSGCIAVAALPLLASGAMVGGGHFRIRAATPRPKPAGTVRVVPANEERTGGAAIAIAPVLPPALTQPPGRGESPLPPGLRPPERLAADPWRDFVDYAADKGAAMAGATTTGRARGRSVLLEAGTPLGLPKLRQCDGKVPAVVIDLDSGPQAFVPGAARAPSPALVEGLARMREAGMAVVWITALPAREVTAVAEALKTSGLDPVGSDPLLLVRNGGDRKQVLREDAARDVCVIAIAGDRKGDFDELFDYLRDQSSGESLDYLLGAGWFIVPPPL